MPLDVYGDGPEREEIAANAPAGVEFKGQVPNGELRALLPGYTGMVFRAGAMRPKEWLWWRHSRPVFRW